MDGWMDGCMYVCMLWTHTLTNTSGVLEHKWRASLKPNIQTTKIKSSC